MKVIELTASNLLRLKAVTITPDHTLQVIGGRNAQGKSSVLNALWLALGGGTAAREFVRPVRDGEDEASVTLDLGDLIVERTWHGDKTALTVKAPDGARYTSPQAMLDKLVGRLSFDPLAFTHMKSSEQRAALLDLLGLDLSTLDADRDQAYAQRTEVGRRVKAIGDVQVDPDLPEHETSAGELVAAIREASRINRDRADAFSRLDDAREKIERLRADLAQWEERAAEAERRLAACPERADVAALETQLEDVEDTNQRIRANTVARQQAANKEALTARYHELTERIASIDQQKAEAIATADFPVAGLGFDESGVTYQGVPFAQASSAEQIRVSLAMAMALNPTLRVLRVQDGSLLDADTMAAIRQQVADHDYQLWIERVGDADEGAVIIEDGGVRS